MLMVMVTDVASLKRQVSMDVCEGLSELTEGEDLPWIRGVVPPHVLGPELNKKTLAFVSASSLQVA